MSLSLQVAVDSLKSAPMRTALSVIAFTVGTAALSAVLLLSDSLADLNRRQIAAAGTINIQVRPVKSYWLDGIPFEYADPTPTIPTALAERLASLLGDRASVVVVDSVVTQVQIGARTRGIAVVSRQVIGASATATPESHSVATISEQLDALLTREYASQRPATLALDSQAVPVGGIEPTQYGVTALAIFVTPQVLAGVATTPSRYLLVVPRGSEIDDEYRAIYREVTQVARRDSLMRGRIETGSRGPAQVGSLNTGITVFRISFASLALLCILVAGLGAANVILLATVQRAREIGLRRSVGATRGAIRAQFIAESMLIAVAGGVLGLVLGRIFVGGVAAVIASRTSSIVLDVQFTAFSALLPLLTSVGIGLVAASIPAAHAARLDPAVALRDE